MTHLIALMWLESLYVHLFTFTWGRPSVVEIIPVTCTSNERVFFSFLSFFFTLSSAIRTNPSPSIQDGDGLVRRVKIQVGERTAVKKRNCPSKPSVMEWPLRNWFCSLRVNKITTSYAIHTLQRIHYTYSSVFSLKTVKCVARNSV